MIIVSNTSPLTNLAAIGQFHLLHNLYTCVHIADGVWDELHAGGFAWPGAEHVAAANWIERHTIEQSTRVHSLLRDLDRGEAESIVLALELGADWVLMDEREGRQIARRLGLQVVGVIGILLDAKAQHQIEQISPLLDALRSVSGFYISQAL